MTRTRRAAAPAVAPPVARRRTRYRSTGLLLAALLLGGAGLAKAGLSLLPGTDPAHAHALAALPLTRPGAPPSYGPAHRIQPYPSPSQAPSLTPVEQAALARARADVPDSARIGALFGDDGGHHCTASVVGPDLILTAAHCDADGRFAPGYHSGHSPYGRWPLGDRTVDRAWSRHRDQDHDVAFIQVGTLNGKHIGDVVGYNTVAFDRGFGLHVTVTGYPSRGDRAVSGSNVARRYTDHQMRIRVPGLAMGTSGGPWVDDDGEVVGVVGGHDAGGYSVDISFSVYFDGTVRRLFDAAAT